jgi:hypothetical protein
MNKWYDTALFYIKRLKWACRQINSLTISNLLFDLRYGGFSGGTVRTKHESLGACDTDNTSYRALAYLFKDISITPTDVLVDVGCGKGRVINWWLSRRIGNPIIGVELDEEIAAWTRRRLRKYRNVTILQGNALTLMPLPGTIYYLYNPFTEPVVRQFKEKLEQASASNIRIIYFNNLHAHLFQNNPGWEVKSISVPIAGAHPASLIERRRS